MSAAPADLWQVRHIPANNQHTPSCISMSACWSCTNPRACMPMQIMPVDTVGFQLRPVGFFASNPTLDVPPQTNRMSQLHPSCPGVGTPRLVAHSQPGTPQSPSPRCNRHFTVHAGAHERLAATMPHLTASRLSQHSDAAAVSDEAAKMFATWPMPGSRDGLAAEADSNGNAAAKAESNGNSGHRAD